MAEMLAIPRSSTVSAERRTRRAIHILSASITCPITMYIVASWRKPLC